ncbi:MAG UNVERIFIED_CONTAM: hypothetical protein LVT10_22610 [Anaerolineae bacterium]
MGGVSLILSPELSITFLKHRCWLQMASVKPSDASANGYVRGEGAGSML